MSTVRELFAPPLHERRQADGRRIAGHGQRSGRQTVCTTCPWKPWPAASPGKAITVPRLHHRQIPTPTARTLRAGSAQYPWLRQGRTYSLLTPLERGQTITSKRFFPATSRSRSESSRSPADSGGLPLPGWTGMLVVSVETSNRAGKRSWRAGDVGFIKRETVTSGPRLSVDPRRKCRNEPERLGPAICRQSALPRSEPPRSEFFRQACWIQNSMRNAA